MNIVFIASEAAPLAKTGGLADVVAALPRALQKKDHDVTVILPYYRSIIDATGVMITPMNIHIEMWMDGITRIAPLHRCEVDGLAFVLIEQDDLFDREGLYGSANGAYEDNPLQFIFFDRVALEAAAHVYSHVDIIHCHDWQTGFIPLMLKEQYQHRPQIADARTVFTIHNLAYQGVFAEQWIERLGLPTQWFHPQGYEFHGQLNCMKAGILAADEITTVSPSYAQEILTPAYGCQLDGFLQKNSGKLQGILNGLDVDSHNPATDLSIAKPFQHGKMAGKKACKTALQRYCGFTESTKTPLLTLISRLAEQKGIDLIIANLSKWVNAGWQVAILGSGDAWLEAGLHAAAASHPEQIFFHCGFNDTLARKIYAGGDMFLMPSRFEPCGLGQLLAMCYGNVPIVRQTGGLIDTVVDYQQHKSKASGLSFVEASPEAFNQAVCDAVALYKQARIWSRIRGNGIRRDSSWAASADRYIALYKQLCV
ncbi:MAG: glycogen synthase GlgA [Mariprofundaceae bacterium]|nr:glycogen synthase GlgA [Mariprofundaceae bacterium]